MYALNPKMTHRRLISISGGCIPKIGPRSNKLTRRLCLEKLILRQISIVRPDGTNHNTRSIGHPILDERGDVVEFVGASIDVTEHHRAEQALRRSEAYLARRRDSRKRALGNDRVRTG